ncbi:transcriptional regulator [uncultured Helicobacter sp.]|uniref:transcriptional regulator n=1 Tax=uncultured Helicobacter sp. TaxID=175537 RepID=UPI001C3A999A|nr:transcriptional regulator [Candidatus Helicobacter avicola]
MPSSREFKDFVLEQLESSTEGYRFSARKMFGEYCIYVQDLHTPLETPKPLFLLCDDMLFIKQYKELATFLESAPKAPPFVGAKDWHIIDVDSHALLGEVIQTIVPFLPEPKPKKPRKVKPKIQNPLKACPSRY